MLNDDERRELAMIEAALQGDDAYATSFAINAEELGRHDPGPRRWTLIALVAVPLCMGSLAMGLPILALLAGTVAVACVGARAMAGLQPR